MQWGLVSVNAKESQSVRYRNVCTLAIYVDSHVFACSHARNVRENKRFPHLVAYFQFSD